MVIAIALAARKMRKLASKVRRADVEDSNPTCADTWDKVLKSLVPVQDLDAELDDDLNTFDSEGRSPSAFETGLLGGRLHAERRAIAKALVALERHGACLEGRP